MTEVFFLDELNGLAVLAIFAGMWTLALTYGLFLLLIQSRSEERKADERDMEFREALSQLMYHLRKEGLQDSGPISSEKE